MENLNIGTRINGTQDDTDNGIIEKYCYDNSDSLCNIYGVYTNGIRSWITILHIMGILI